MSLLDILEYPDPRLRTVADPVTQFGADLQKFCDDLLETMYEAPGIGLAATQVNNHKRIIAVDVSEDRKFIYVHAIDVPDPEALKRDIAEGFERKIKEAFE